MAHTRPAGHATAALAAAAVLALAACDIPTEAPEWDTEWEVTVDSSRLSVAALLPASVGVTPDRQSFLLTVAPTAISRTLGEICGAACTLLNGRSVLKPAFTFTFTDQLELPADVITATLTGGSVVLTLRHDFSFDPLNPPGATSSGTITVTVRHDGTVLGSTVIRGDATPFPAGTTLTRTVALQPATLSGPLTLEVTLQSPASGEPVLIDTSDRFTLTATPTDVRIAAASVVVQDRPVQLAAGELDLSGVDAFVIDHVKGGALVLEIDNPFAVAGTFTLRIDTPTGVIIDAVELRPGPQKVRVELSAAELRRILGNTIAVRVSGHVTGTGGGVSVTPAQELVVRTRLELVLGPEEG